MKLLLDHGLPRTAADALTQLGFSTVHVGAVGMATASDGEILARAAQQGETVVTLDADFHKLLALANAVSPSVIRIRIEGLRGAEVAAIVSDVVAACHADLAAGAMVTVDRHRIRVRRLPLVAP